jgi:hypothetical protein
MVQLILLTDLYLGWRVRPYSPSLYPCRGHGGLGSPARCTKEEVVKAVTTLLEILLIIAKILAEVLVKIVVEKFVSKLSQWKRKKKSDSKVAATSRETLK